MILYLHTKERICKWCWKEVQDEIHFLLKCEALQNVRTPFIDLINNNNYNFKHLDIREQFIWLMSNEDNFIINQLSDMILKLHSSRYDIIQINNSNNLCYTILIIIMYTPVLDIQLWIMYCLLIYYRDACQNYWLKNCIFTCICMSCMLNPIYLIITINVYIVIFM